ncbi:hypothetical protein ACQP00_28930 [Dactylosporangium sp. CS-047395]|uniref:hypothetical protein n=1 Tax=Dactylosporangium sp. CS-047395 TaxID=3239936 RepID=UPI003D911F0C
MSVDASHAALPKAHVHLHLDGAMRRSTLFELAGRAGLVATLPSGYGSFAAFTDTITAAARCLRTAADARRLVDEIAPALAGIEAWLRPGPA